MFKKAAVFTDIHFGLKGNSRVHNDDCEEFIDWYIQTAKDNGCEQYTRVPALGINETFINAMSELIIKKEEYKFNEFLYPPKTKCPSHLKKCPCLNYE